MIELFNANCTEQNTTNLLELTNVIKKSFLTVAKDFNLTPQNSPTNPAFTNTDKVAFSIDNGRTYWVYRDDNFNPSSITSILGCVSISPSIRENVYYIEHLAVLPEQRHKGIGRELLSFACAQIFYQGATTAAIGIIEDNKILKQWYKDFGFVETEIRNLSHLAFTACIMEKQLKATSIVDSSQLCFNFQN